jgi:uncharacterized BrkB/YihY/UPF0761 family membrane protein
MPKKPVRRNLLLQVLWSVLTLGMYVIYWFYITSKEMAEYLGRDESVTLWTFLFGFPPFCLYSYYKQGELYELISDGAVNRWITVILWIFFPPAVWLIVQNKLNELADAEPAPAL